MRNYRASERSAKNISSRPNASTGTTSLQDAKNNLVIDLKACPLRVFVLLEKTRVSRIIATTDMIVVDRL